MVVKEAPSCLDTHCWGYIFLSVFCILFPHQSVLIGQAPAEVQGKFQIIKKEQDVVEEMQQSDSVGGKQMLYLCKRGEIA